MTPIIRAWRLTRAAASRRPLETDDRGVLSLCDVSVPTVPQTLVGRDGGQEGPFLVKLPVVTTGTLLVGAIRTGTGGTWGS